MPMSLDQKAIVRTYMSRKLRTLPILIVMFFSLLPLSSCTFTWLRGQLAWHKTEAEIIQINDDGRRVYRYTCEKTGDVINKTYLPYRILVHYEIGQDVKEHDMIRIAYNPKMPDDDIIFSLVELKMLTWASVFAFCFIIYFWLEWVLKKRAKIKIAG